MEEQDRQFIEGLFARQGEHFQRELQRTSEQFQQELQRTSEQFQQEVRRNSEHFQQALAATTEEFKKHVTSVVEVGEHKVSIIAEGHHAILEKLEIFETRFDRLEAKVDTIRTELAAHKADPDAHHGLYRVKEST